MLERFAMKELLAWKSARRRKPLIVRGARQVGKTWLVKEFGRTQYKRCVYVNFDMSAKQESGEELKAVFEGSLDPYRIVRALENLYNVTIVPEETLLIFDEAQDQPRALSSLKYFNELAPEYHVVVAGSHMGMMLHDGASIPVGNVSFLYLYPMTFMEFAVALGYEKLVGTLGNRDWTTIELTHGKLVELLRQYLCVGGMPEVVDDYRQQDNWEAVRVLQQDILKSYRADFSKHAPIEQLARVWQVWDSIPAHLSRENKRLVWGAVRPGARAKEFELALQWLFDYGVAYQVSRISKPSLPLRAYVEESIFKLFMVDVGLLGARAGLEISAILQPARVFTEFKGALTEQYVCQQLIAHGIGGYDGNNPCYWAGKAAEIDFVVQVRDDVVPLEVKAAENLQSKSLKSYRERFSPRVAVRTSLSKYREDPALVNIPLYAIGQIMDIVAGIK